MPTTLAENARRAILASVATVQPLPPGEGLAFVTHHVPPFTAARVTPAGERLEQAACGQFVASDQLAPVETAPTCRLCRIAVDQ